MQKGNGAAWLTGLRRVDSCTDRRIEIWRMAAAAAVRGGGTGGKRGGEKWRTVGVTQKRASVRGFEHGNDQEGVGVEASAFRGSTSRFRQRWRRCGAQWRTVAP